MSQENATGMQSSEVLREAEILRRSGRAEAALERIEEALGNEPDNASLRLGLALALLDLGRLEDTRHALEQSLPLETPMPETAAAWSGEEAASPGDIGDVELETAFAQATSDPEQMVSADHVAQAALRSIEGDAPEGVEGGPLSDATFQTATMAGLLESQGHSDEAEQIREAVSQRDTSATHPLIPVLERWLVNLRRAHP